MLKLVAALGIFLTGLLAPKTQAADSSPANNVKPMALFKMTDYEY